MGPLATTDLTGDVTCHVLGERVTPTQHVNAAKWVNFTMPATWCQHWKEDHKGTWYGRRIVARWPIRLEIVTKMVQMSVPIERWRTFPQAEVPYPKQLGDMVPALIAGDVEWIAP